MTGDKMTEKSHAPRVGDRMLWMRESRGGYGYRQTIPVRIVSLGVLTARVQPLDPGDLSRDNLCRQPRNVRFSHLMKWES